MASMKASYSQMKDKMDVNKAHIDELYKEMNELRTQHKRELDIANTSKLLNN